MTAHPDTDRLESSARRLGDILRKQGRLMVTAESCTGGWIAQTVTAIAGSSQWFDRGYITYSNRAKREVLGVAERSLITYGAVSAEIAAQMALGALEAAKVAVAVAVTGVAGPDGGTRENPVGTVWFGWCIAGGLPVTKLERFDGDRRSVRAQTVAIALDGLIELTSTGTVV
ncbi:MAG: CinA family protein [Proteobacteria bacterium]|nr:MAG: CinA family protein [Pseudomonadota bacterium]